MFFQSRFLDLLFLIVLSVFILNDRFGDPLKNPMGAKIASKKKNNINHGFSMIIKQFCFEPCFHETIEITVPLGHRGF